MIPKIIHQIWVGDYKIPLREKLLVEKIKTLHSDYEHVLWSHPEEDLPDNLKKWYNKFYTNKDFAFCADVIRLWACYKYGGFYLDVDWDIKNKLDFFLNYDGVFFHHTDDDLTMPNQVFGVKKESEILKYCINDVSTEFGWFGPSWFGETIKKSFNIKKETLHKEIREIMNNQNIEYYSYGLFEQTFGIHLSAYSWSPENKLRFKQNEQL